MLNGFVLQNDEKIIAFGTSNTNGIYSNLLVRYLPNGDLDLNFGVDGIVLSNFEGEYLNVLSGQVQENGLINLFVKNGSYPNAKLQIVQYLEDGTLDATFGINGVLTVESGLDYSGGAMNLKDDGSFIISFTKPFSLAVTIQPK